MMTDDEIMERACSSLGCINFREEGYVVCIHHLYGKPVKLPPGPAKRKRELNAIRKGKDNASL